MENKWAGHPTFDYACFNAHKEIVFGVPCIIEEVQDGEIWSEYEYWGSRLLDFINDRTLFVNSYRNDGDDWERIITNWSKDGKDPFENEETISEHIEDFPLDKDAYDFYKAWIESDIEDKEKFIKHYESINKLSALST